MKLAVTAQNGQVFQHFGKCPSFAVFTVEGKAASAPVLLDATGSGHAAMAGFLKNNGVDTVICGGIGAPAKQMLLDQGIQVVSGASGDIDAAVQAFLDGTLRIASCPPAPIITVSTSMSTTAIAAAMARTAMSTAEAITADPFAFKRAFRPFFSVQNRLAVLHYGQKDVAS